MTERRASRPAEIRPANDVAWEATLGEALGVAPEPCADLVHGRGVRFRLGEPCPITVEVFPVSRVARFSTPDLQLALFNQGPPTLAAEGIVFEPRATAHRYLSLSPTGDLLLMAPPEGTRGPQRPATTPRSATPRPDEETALLGVSAPADDAQPLHAIVSPASLLADWTPQGSPNRTEQPNNRTASAARDTSEPATPGGASQTPLASPEAGQPRVAFSGRLGRDPVFKPNRRQTVAEFPVAVRIEGREQPEWRTVVVFGERAEKLRDTVRKGDTVECVCYEHERVRKGKDGTAQVRKQYYATVVKRR